VRLNLCACQAAGVEREDLLVKAVEAGLPLFDQLRLELAVAVTRHLDVEPAALAAEGLGIRAVAGGAGGAPFGGVLLVTEVMSQFTLQCAFEDGFGELLEQAVMAEEQFRSGSVFEQFVNQFGSD